MVDTFINTTQTSFDDSLVPLIQKKLQDVLRAGLGYLPKGSVLPAVSVKGGGNPSGGIGIPFRSFAFSDLPDNGGSTIEDDDANDPEIESLDLDFVQFLGERFARTVGFTTNAQRRSPFNITTVAADKIARAIVTKFDLVGAALYAAGDNLLFGGDATDAAEVASGDILTAKLVKDAVAILRATDVKPLTNGLYALVASPFALRDLQDDDDYVKEQQFANPETFLTGQIGTYAGAAIIPTSRAIGNPGAVSPVAELSTATLIGADALFMGDVGSVETFFTPPGGHDDPVHRSALISYAMDIGGVLNTLQAPRYLNIVVAPTLAQL